MIQNAVILAAGRGKRLDRPGTPKPLIEVGGKAIVVRLIEQLERVGVKKVCVVVGFDGQKIVRKLAGHRGISAELCFVENLAWEKGIASSVACVESSFDEPFLLAMADHLFDDELIELLAGMALGEGELAALVDKRISEVFSLDAAVKVQLEGDHVVDLDKAMEVFDGVDCGLFAVTPQGIFEAVREGIEGEGVYSLFGCLKGPAKAGRLKAVLVEHGHWDDVDTPSDLVNAEMRIRQAQRVKRVSAPSRAIDASAVTAYDFVTGEPKVARMVVGRGFVKDPTSIELIPAASASSPIFVFTDETVGELYGRHFIESLRGQGYNIHGIVLPDGEESKTLANFVYLVERVLSRGVDEASVFISLGGGVVANVCGFIASTIYRGLDLVHLPTSLMAQCDAAISHKQAINSHLGKNMVGAYYSPRLVAVDVETLSTLNERLIRDGMSEVVKHALGQDPEYVDFLMSYEGNFALDLDFLEAVVNRNIELKCILARDDPKELREAMVLQYGHTAGHPIEHLSGYQLYHGESVAIGMMIAARVSRILGGCKDDLVELHERIIKRFGLPITAPRSIIGQDMVNALKYNKRYLTEGTRMALLSGVGELWNVNDNYVIPVPDHVLLEAFNQTLESENAD